MPSITSLDARHRLANHGIELGSANCSTYRTNYFQRLIPHSHQLNQVKFHLVCRLRFARSHFEKTDCKPGN